MSAAGGESSLGDTITPSKNKVTDEKMQKRCKISTLHFPVPQHAGKNIEELSSFSCNEVP